MVTGKKFEDVTIESILQEVSEYDLIRHLLGKDFIVGESFCNTMRGENSESAIVREVDHKLCFKDYGNSLYNGDAFYLWGFYYNLSGLNEILQDIHRVFGLGQSVKSPVITWKTPKIVAYKPPPLIQWTYRAKGTKSEHGYWDDYYQGEDDLKRENIFFPKDIWINKRKQPKSDLLTFIYWYPKENGGQGSTKLYKPHGQMGKKVWYDKRKWMSNLRFDYIENLKGLEGGCDKSFALTSKKDRMVFRTITGLDCSYNIQGENISCFTDENLEYIRTHSNQQFYLGDGDLPGIKCANMIKENLGFTPIVPPIDKPKDYALWTLERGMYEVREFFKQKQLIDGK